jgi:hypothetical protein
MPYPSPDGYLICGTNTPGGGSAVQFAVPATQCAVSATLGDLWGVANDTLSQGAAQPAHFLHGTRVGVRGCGATQLRDVKSLAGDFRDRWGRVEPASCPAVILIS